MADAGDVLAIIPARGGSRGLPRKNLAPFAGRPLIAHSIDVALRSPTITRTLVSTDSQEIAGVARECGADVPFLRPAELAGDRTPIAATLVDLLERLEADEGYVPRWLVVLQPTSPLRTVDDVEGALGMLLASQAEAVVAVCAGEGLLFTEDDDGGLRLAADPKLLASTNRQEVPRAFRLTGSVYAIARDRFMQQRSFLEPPVLGYEVPAWRSVDVNDRQDLIVAECLHRHAAEIERAA